MDVFEAQREAAAAKAEADYQSYRATVAKLASQPGKLSATERKAFFAELLPSLSISIDDAQSDVKALQQLSAAEAVIADADAAKPRQAELMASLSVLESEERDALASIARKRHPLLIEAEALRDRRAAGERAQATRDTIRTEHRKLLALPDPKTLKNKRRLIWLAQGDTMPTDDGISTISIEGIMAGGDTDGNFHPTSRPEWVPAEGQTAEEMQKLATLAREIVQQQTSTGRQCRYLLDAPPGILYSGVYLPPSTVAPTNEYAFVLHPAQTPDAFQVALLAMEKGWARHTPTLRTALPQPPSARIWINATKGKSRPETIEPTVLPITVIDMPEPLPFVSTPAPEAPAQAGDCREFSDCLRFGSAAPEVTPPARRFYTMSDNDTILRWVVAVHEACHAVVGVKLGIPVDYARIDVEGANVVGGKCYQSRPAGVTHASVATMLAAGPVGMRMLIPAHELAVVSDRLRTDTDFADITTLANTHRLGIEGIIFHARASVQHNAASILRVARMLQCTGIVRAQDDHALLVTRALPARTIAANKPSRPRRCRGLCSKPPVPGPGGAGVIHGLPVMSIGFALDGFPVTAATLASLLSTMKRKPPVCHFGRATYSDVAGQVMQAERLGVILGDIRNPRIVGGSVIADVTFGAYASRLPKLGDARKYLMALADAAPQRLALEPDLTITTDPTGAPVITSIDAIDIIERTAA